VIVGKDWRRASLSGITRTSAMWILFRMSERVDLRVDPFVFFHVSNGYLAASNPGMDELATRFGVNYHLGKRER
jgi:hypothetical protein